MSDQLELYIPGPTQVSDEVLQALAEPTMAFSHAGFHAVYRETIALAQQVFETKHDVFLIQGSGTTGLDASINALVREGDEVAVVVNGGFGRRLQMIAESYGGRPILIESAWGEVTDPNVVEDVIARNPSVRALLTVHSETSTGALNPVKELAEVANRRGIPILVDAISSLGGTRMAFDEWGITVCISCSQKCLETPPGLALVAMSPQGWEYVEQRGQPKGFYLNLNNWRRDGAGRRLTGPSTFSSNLCKGIRAALRRVVGEGLENRYTRHAQAAATFRAGFKELGFRSFANEATATPTVSTVIPPEGLTVGEVLGWLERERNILVARGMGPAAGSPDGYMRVGHQGPTATQEKVNALLEAFAACVAAHRVAVPAQV